MKCKWTSGSRRRPSSVFVTSPEGKLATLEQQQRVTAAERDMLNAVHVCIQTCVWMLRNAIGTGLEVGQGGGSDQLGNVLQVPTVMVTGVSK
jgi:hypothetical protein